MSNTPQKITIFICTSYLILYKKNSHGVLLYMAISLPSAKHHYRQYGVLLMVNFQSLQLLLSILDQSHLCPGNPDETFISMASAHKGHLVSTSGSVKASVESNARVTFNDISYTSTIRTASCSLLVQEGQCKSCKMYRSHV